MLARQLVVCTAACAALVAPSAARAVPQANPAGLLRVGNASSPRNVFGVGLVSEGNQEQYNYVKSLAGDGGWILLVFAGVDSTTTGPQPSWTQAVAAVQQLNLNPVIRISPPWGSAHYRSESDDTEHRNYTTLAAAFRAVVAGLPRVEDRNIYVQVDNEPDLCYEWWCATAEPNPLPFATTAAEYASFFAAVADEIHGIGDPRFKVAPAGLAPGGCQQCGCCGQSDCGDADKPGITGLQFMQAMADAVPGVWDKADFLASHACVVARFVRWRAGGEWWID
jgi:hypothetical protein